MRNSKNAERFFGSPWFAPGVLAFIFSVGLYLAPARADIQQPAHFLGTFTVNDCGKASAQGFLVSAGAPCGAGGGGVTSLSSGCGSSVNVSTGAVTVTGVGVCGSYVNEAGTGTAGNKLVKLTAAGTAIITTAGDTGGAIGIVYSGGGTTGSAIIQSKGQITCIWDSSATIGHYATISASVAGDCHDAGASYPTSGQVIGQALGGGTTALLDMSLGQASASAGGGGPSITQGAWASLPATCTAGDLYLPIDSIINPVRCGASNVWSSFVSLFSGLVAPPVLASFTVVNAGTSTTDTTHGGIRFSTITGDNAFNVHMLVRAAPATPYHVITCLIPSVSVVANSQIGLVFRESATGKLNTWGTFQTVNTQYVSFFLSDPTTFSSTIVNANPANAWSAQVCLRIGDDGTTSRTYDISVDGRLTWVNLGSEGRTSNYIADQVGLMVDGPAQTGYFLDYEETP